MSSVILRCIGRQARHIKQSTWKRRYRVSLEGSVPPSSVSVRTVDLRSDTVTQPGPAMRRAMAEAEVGDDVYGEDPSVNKLQELAAHLFGMEASLFVPSGTMSNLISVMTHCQQRGEEIIVGDRAHLHVYEQGGSAQCAGVHARTVRNNPDGTFNLDEVESKIRHDFPDSHYPRTRLICVENTHNITGGRVLPHSFLKEGLGAPVGSLLGGTKPFVERAVRARKVLGGGMRQAGILAAAGIVAITDMVDRLQDDHRNAKAFAQALLQTKEPLYWVDVEAVETNIVVFKILDPHVDPDEFCRRMKGVTVEEAEVMGQGVRVLMQPHYDNSVRAVWHLNVSEEDTRLAIHKMAYVTERFNQETSRL
ncbi:threonine aldolase 1 isoform X2 [Polypterus senegalus]|uniref:threonine aldolase 1 isoform X2 n=1 Tax=Polypterus senegalus TaxID=55291 RepID=UPI001962B544|nr:threonine aldolase 1 isoform X2 [Polypterus senegalus]